MNPRITFRPASEGEAWQKQLRDRYLAEGTPSGLNLSLGASVVRPVSKTLARTIILRYEWLGTMSPTRWHFGIFFGSHCAGATCVGVGCTGGTSAHMMFGITPRELLTLARGACVHWAPPGANSRLVAWTAKLLAKEKAGKLMIAYADSDAGEIGTIYQACGWVYTGRTMVTRQWVSPNGIAQDAKKPDNLKKVNGGTWSQWKAALLANGWREQRTNPKHRYVFPLDRQDPALAARLAELSRPYPKRDLPAACHTPSSQTPSERSSGSGTTGSTGRGRCDATRSL